MPSNALENLEIGLAEIQALQRANPSPQQGSGLKRPEVVRAMGRSEIVLLSSHFERYIRALNEEAVDSVCNSSMTAADLSERLKLQHARHAIDKIYEITWERRADALTDYSARESWLWEAAAPISMLDSSRLLTWMKAPTAKNVIRAFGLWGIPDIFRAITRKPIHYGRLRLRIDELVEKRNNIAHGDFTVEATYLDVVQYTSAVRRFCTSADLRLASQLSRTLHTRPW